MPNPKPPLEEVWRRWTTVQLNTVWLHAFTTTIRDRAAIPGSASEPLNRFQVAVQNADEAVSTHKAIEGWLRLIKDETKEL